MTYQRQSEIPRKGRTDQEKRIENLLVELAIPYSVNQVVCFVCRNQFSNPSENSYPSHCSICQQVFNEKGLYCMPDFIINNGRKGVLNINGGIHDKSNRHIQKDRYQIQELMSIGYPVRIIKNEEIDNTTNTGLKERLYAYWLSIANLSLYERFGRGEKEIACLR